MDIAAVESFRDSGVRSEDGIPIVIRDVLIWAQMADGSRYQHRHVFAGKVEYHTCDYDFDIPYTIKGDMDAATKFAHKIQTHVNVGGQLNMAHWDEIDPAYASLAYQRLDAEGYFYFAEKYAEDY